MNGVDAIAFTAGVGENDKTGRKNICSSLAFMGVEIDDEANNVRGEERVISSPNSKVKVMLIPTNEELAIARETLAPVSYTHLSPPPKRRGPAGTTDCVPMVRRFKRKALTTVAMPMTQNTGAAWVRISAELTPAAPAETPGAPWITKS